MVVLVESGPDAGLPWHFGNPVTEARSLEKGDGVVVDDFIVEIDRMRESAGSDADPGEQATPLADEENCQTVDAH